MHPGEGSPRFKVVKGLLIPHTHFKRRVSPELCLGNRRQAFLLSALNAPHSLHCSCFKLMCKWAVLDHQQGITHLSPHRLERMVGVTLMQHVILTPGDGWCCTLKRITGSFHLRTWTRQEQSWTWIKCSSSLNQVFPPSMPCF